MQKKIKPLIGLSESQSKLEIAKEKADRNPMVVPSVSSKVSDVSKQIMPLSPRMAQIKMAATQQV